MIEKSKIIRIEKEYSLLMTPLQSMTKTSRICNPAQLLSYALFDRHTKVHNFGEYVPPHCAIKIKSFRNKTSNNTNTDTKQCYASNHGEQLQDNNSQLWLWVVPVQEGTMRLWSLVVAHIQTEGAATVVAPVLIGEHRGSVLPEAICHHLVDIGHL